MSCCSNFFSVLTLMTVLDGAARPLPTGRRAPRPPWCRAGPPGSGEPVGTRGGGARASGTRTWGAGALPVPVPGPPDRGRPPGLLPGHRRRRATTRTCWSAPGIRCRCVQGPGQRARRCWRTCTTPAFRLRWRTAHHSTGSRALDRTGNRSGQLSSGGATGTAGSVAGSAGASSDRMSIRQPVSRAASRAFWPSLPMASDSW